MFEEDENGVRRATGINLMDVDNLSDEGKEVIAFLLDGLAKDIKSKDPDFIPEDVMTVKLALCKLIRHGCLYICENGERVWVEPTGKGVLEYQLYGKESGEDVDDNKRPRSDA